MKKRTIKRIIIITLCTVLAIFITAPIVAPIAVSAVKKLDEIGYVGGYKVSNIIGKTTIKNAIYAGRECQIIDGKECYFDYYFTKRYYFYFMDDYPLDHTFDLLTPVFVRTELDDDGKIVNVDYGYPPDDLNWWPIYRDNKRSITFADGVIGFLCTWPHLLLLQF